MLELLCNTLRGFFFGGGGGGVCFHCNIAAVSDHMGYHLSFHVDGKMLINIGKYYGVFNFRIRQSNKCLTLKITFGRYESSYLVFYFITYIF